MRVRGFVVTAVAVLLVGAGVWGGLAVFKGSSGEISGPVPPLASSASRKAFEVRAYDAADPSEQYALSDWDIDTTKGGAIEHVSIGGPEPRALSAGTPVALTAQDVLLITGWAGDAAVGLRFTHVILSVCGRAVGIAEVKDTRSDIKAFVHPGLDPAGWVARLPVSLLPRCDAPKLEAYAVRDARFAYPLDGGMPLMLPPEAEKGAEAVIASADRPRLLRPGDLPPTEQALIQVKYPTVNVRRCAAKECVSIGYLEAGRHRVWVLERRENWVLIVSEHTAGWLAEEMYSITSEADQSETTKKVAPAKAAKSAADAAREATKAISKPPPIWTPPAKTGEGTKEPSAGTHDPAQTSEVKNSEKKVPEVKAPEVKTPDTGKISHETAPTTEGKGATGEEKPKEE